MSANPLATADSFPDQSANLRKQPRIVSVFPYQLPIAVGANGALIVTIDAKQEEATELKVLADQSNIVEMPPTVSIPAGEIQTIFTISRLEVGITTLSVSLNGTVGQTVVEMPSAQTNVIKPWWKLWSAKPGQPASSNKRSDSIQRASNSLLGSLTILLAMFLAVYVALRLVNVQVTLLIVLLFGALGSFLSQQRRLRELSEEDLELFNSSMIYKWLSPIAGATLAGILYLIFIGDLLGGELFPNSTVL